MLSPSHIIVFYLATCLCLHSLNSLPKSVNVFSKLHAFLPNKSLHVPICWSSHPFCPLYVHHPSLEDYRQLTISSHAWPWLPITFSTLAQAYPQASLLWLNPLWPWICEAHPSTFCFWLSCICGCVCVCVFVRSLPHVPRIQCLLCLS